MNRALFAKQLEPGLNTLFGLEHARYPEQWKEIFSQNSSSKAFEEDNLLEGFGAASVKAEGSAVAYDTAAELWTARYNHETIALGFAITEEAIEDNLYDSLSARYTKALARAMAYTKQVKAVNPLNNGFTNSFQSGDGVNLFTADGDGVTGGDGHPLVDGGKNSNRPSTAADLNETSLENAIIEIAAFKDQRGLKIAARPRRLIVPSALQFTATRLLESQFRVGSSDNDVNAIVTNGAIPEGYMVNHYLTDTNAFFIITDVPNGMKHFNRTGMETSMDGDFDTGNVRYKARERYSFGVSDPLGIYGSPGSS